jgi:hypothetical protein
MAIDLTGTISQLIGAETLLQQLADYGQIAAGIASVAVVGSVLLVRKQVKLQADNSRAELVTVMTGLMVSVSRAFIEHPDMRKYFHDGEKPTGTDRELARAIAVTIADAMDHVAEYLDRMSDPAQTAWKAYVNDTYAKSPVLQEYLQTHKSWYGPKLLAQLRIDAAV